MTGSEFLANLKAGDEVCIHSRLSGNRIVRISRRTATRVFVENMRGHGEVGFRLSDGYLVGGNDWDQTWIREVSQKDRDTMERLAAVSTIERAIKLPETSLEVLRAMCATLSGNTK